jgi:hypothetical protein
MGDAHFNNTHAKADEPQSEETIMNHCTVIVSAPLGAIGDARAGSE